MQPAAKNTCFVSERGQRPEEMFKTNRKDTDAFSTVHRPSAEEHLTTHDLVNCGLTVVSAADS